MTRRFRQVDVFGDAPYLGNPVAVVLDADGIETAVMQRFANWTNLSETTFVLPPSDPTADYRVRIFTPVAELPFAGHPTLGTCHAWLAAGGTPRDPATIVQESDAGLVRVRRIDDRLAFAAPPLVRSGPVDDAMLERIARVLSVDRSEIVDAQWVDNGPGWVAALFETAERVLALRPGLVDFDLGVVGAYPAGSPVAFEVRAWFPTGDASVEDPVTGSLNASLAEWLLRTGRATSPYIASQGSALGRQGRIRVSRDDEGTIWVGGNTVTIMTGDVEI